MATEEKLSTIGKFDLQRRMDIAGACIHGCLVFAGKMNNAQSKLDEYEKSKLLYWAIGISLASYFAGSYLWWWFYAPLAVTLPMTVERLIDKYVQEKEVSRLTEQLSFVRINWMIGGHTESAFYSLVRMTRNPEFSLDSDDYQKWWYGVYEWVKRQVISIQD